MINDCKTYVLESRLHFKNFDFCSFKNSNFEELAKVDVCNNTSDYTCLKKSIAIEKQILEFYHYIIIILTDNALY